MGKIIKDFYNKIGTEKFYLSKKYRKGIYNNFLLEMISLDYLKLHGENDNVFEVSFTEKAVKLIK